MTDKSASTFGTTSKERFINSLFKHKEFYKFFLLMLLMAPARSLGKKNIVEIKRPPLRNICIEIQRLFAEKLFSKFHKFPL